MNQTILNKDYTPGSLAYIDKAFEWGLKNGIAIILDLHAAPGAQNQGWISSPPIFGQVRHETEVLQQNAKLTHYVICLGMVGQI